jgi:hypothetical protein
VPDYKSDLPTNYYFGGGDEATAGTPLAVALLLICILLILVLPRKYAYVPFLFAALLLPLHVVVLVGGLHFNATRILVLGGWLRLLLRGSFPGRLQTIDTIVLSSAVGSAVMYCLLWQDMGAVINRAGWLVTTMGSYFLIRFLVQDKEDILRVIATFAVVVIVIAPLMWYEHSSSDNPFWVLGAPKMTDIRDGQIRAQGPFGHAIVAGTVGAVLVPLFVGLYFCRPRARWLAATAAIASIVMVLTSHSSTPVLTSAAVILGMAIWPLRKRMRFVRWGFVIFLVIAQLFMKAPIWFLMTRISAVMGGSGWHRSMLMDNFFRHFTQWWLVGTRANPDWGWSMWDVDNAYVGAGLSGGLVGFVLFIAVLVYAYKAIGKGRKLMHKSPRDQHLVWALGVALFANTVAYFGIVYFDQAIVAWNTLLAMIAIVPVFAASELARQSPPRVAPPDLEISEGDWMNPSPDHVYGNF